MYSTLEERGKYFTQALIGKAKILNDKYAKTGNELTTAMTQGTKLVTSTMQKTRLTKQQGKIKAKTNRPKKPDLHMARNKSVKNSKH